MVPASIILPSSVAPSLYGVVISEWMDPWSDSLICLLRNIPSLTGWPRVINVVGTRGIYLVVNLLEWSVPSSYVSFPLYKPASSSLIFHFPQKFYDKSATITFVRPKYHSISASVIYTRCSSPIGKYSSPFIKELFVIFFRQYYRHLFQTCQCLRVYCHV